MARATGNGRDQVYKVAEHGIDRCLRRDDSLFSPGEAVWTSEAIDDLHNRFVRQKDESSDTFDNKLERQLEGASDQTIQLAAEMLYLYFLFPDTLKEETKRNLIEQVLSWMEEPVAIPEDLDAALDFGIGAGGTAFNVYRYHQIEFLIQLTRALKKKDADERDEILEDPWRFKELVTESAVKGSQAMQDALLHFAFPDSFEPIVFRKAKRRIASEFSDLVTSPTQDIDRKLQQIRRGLVEEYGSGFHFYEPALLDRWRKDASRWGQFIHWARRAYEYEDFDEHERDYKLEIGDKLATFREALETGDEDWHPLLKKAFGAPNNITTFYSHGPLLEWCEENREEAEAAFEALYDERATLEERIRSFSERFPQEVVSGRGTRLNLISFLLMGSGPTEYPPYRVTVFEKAFDLVKHSKPPGSADEAGAYLHALDFLDQVAEEAEARGLEFRDRLDCQGAVWMLTQWDAGDFLPDDEVSAFLEFKGEPVSSDGSGDDGTSPDPRSLDSLAAELYMDVQHLQKIVELLDSKKQIIFHGPPGTGKTYVALELAKHLAGEHGTVERVQFHPSYAYEDFVEGYRPYDLEGQPGFRLESGPLKRIAEEAASRADAVHVLVVDEINRGNIAKIFGELYFLLEYRNEEIQLQYSREKFALPPNVRLIGTMNTADRSIALVDLALRRRFHFFPFFPDEPPVEGLLHRWLDDNKPDMLWVAGLVDRANEKIQDRDSAIGPSHFMRDDLDEEWVERIWEYSVLPYLGEQFYGEPERLGEFDLAVLRDERSPGRGGTAVAVDNDSDVGNAEGTDDPEAQEQDGLEAAARETIPGDVAAPPEEEEPEATTGS